MTFSSIDAEFLEDSCSCIDALNQPHDDDIETAEGVVNEVNDSSGFGFKKNFKTNENGLDSDVASHRHAVAWFQ